MLLNESGEMYLETIYILNKSKSSVHSVDIAEYMNFSKPSVSRAIGLLKNQNHIIVEKDGSIKLTQSGLKIASDIFERHTVLTNILKALGVDEKTASDDACKIEHCISNKSFEAIKNYFKKNSI